MAPKTVIRPIYQGRPATKMVSIGPLIIKDMCNWKNPRVKYNLKKILKIAFCPHIPSWQLSDEKPGPHSQE